MLLYFNFSVFVYQRKYTYSEKISMCILEIKLYSKLVKHVKIRNLIYIHFYINFYHTWFASSFMHSLHQVYIYIIIHLYFICKLCKHSSITFYSILLYDIYQNKNLWGAEGFTFNLPDSVLRRFYCYWWLVGMTYICLVECFSLIHIFVI